MDLTGPLAFLGVANANVAELGAPWRNFLACTSLSEFRMVWHGWTDRRPSLASNLFPGTSHNVFD
jgi:hypothetical protein